MLRGFGVDLAVDQVAGGLAGRGHEVTVYANLTDGTAGGGYRIEQIATPTSPFFWRYERAARRHLDHLDAQGNDIWLVHTFPYYSFIRRLSAPVVAVEYGVSPAEGFPLKLRANFAYMRQMQERFYFPRARRIVTISEYLRGELPVRLRDKASVIYPGADHYHGSGKQGGGRALRRKLKVGDDEILMLYVGRLSSADQPYKGTAELAELCRGLRREDARMRLLMVGYGGARERNWLQKEGALVIDNAPAGQMPAIYDACDIYVTASRWEGFDLPLAEAQSFGRPVAALAVGAHAEVVADGVSGFLAGDIEELGRHLRRLADDEGLRQQMGRAALEQAGRFRWEDTVAGYESLLAGAVDE